jgi:hypothetical protein
MAQAEQVSVHELKSPGLLSEISSSFIQGGSRQMQGVKAAAFFVGIPTAVYLSMRKNKKSKTWMWFSIPAALFFYSIAQIEG